MVKIIREGVLKPRIGSPEGLVAISIEQPKGRLTSNTGYVPTSVSFCDIPESEFNLHIGKYSRFGLGFLKAFVLERGATPMFYVANNSWVPRPAFSNRFSIGERVTRSTEFDDYWEASGRLVELTWLQQAGEMRDILHKIHIFMNFNILPYLKFWNDALPDDDRENYYMEREWRTLGPVKFRLTDIRRAVLPESFAARFREDFPEYFGQISFVD